MFAIAISLSAYAADVPQGPLLKQFAIRPSPTTRPALRYRLRPDAADLTTGNAAQPYLVAAMLLHSAVTPEAQKKIDELSESPLDRPKAAEVIELLVPYRGALLQVAIGARREHCHWDLSLREQGFATFLPHLQALRQAGRLLALQARAQVAQGRFDDAAATLQTGFGMAIHLDSDAVLVQELVGISIAAQMLVAVEDWQRAPGSPNLYWSLSDLPEPMFHFSGAMRLERQVMYVSMPLKDAVAGRLTARQWEQIMDVFRLISDGEPKDQWQNFVRRVAHAAALPRAKAYLRAGGMPQAEIDAMQPYQVLGAYFARSVDEQTQESEKLANLPFPQAHVLSRTVEAEFQEANKDLMNPLAALVPAVARARFSGARLERLVAAQRVVEALRAYAAEHAGSLPAKLADMTSLPIPVDPTTGTDFAYSAAGPRATLHSAAPEGFGPRDALHVEIELLAK